GADDLDQPGERCRWRRAGRNAKGSLVVVQVRGNDRGKEETQQEAEVDQRQAGEETVDAQPFTVGGQQLAVAQEIAGTAVQIEKELVGARRADRDLRFLR